MVIERVVIIVVRMMTSFVKNTRKLVHAKRRRKERVIFDRIAGLCRRRFAVKEEEEKEG